MLAAGSFPRSSAIRTGRWWPHTHGEQPLLDCGLHLASETGCYDVPLGRVGFRKLEVIQDDGLSVAVNGVAIYCRGACWSVADLFNPDGADDIAGRDLALL